MGACGRQRNRYPAPDASPSAQPSGGRSEPAPLRPPPPFRAPATQPPRGAPTLLAHRGGSGLCPRGAPLGFGGEAARAPEQAATARPWAPPGRCAPPVCGATRGAPRLLTRPCFSENRRGGCPAPGPLFARARVPRQVGRHQRQRWAPRARALPAPFALLAGCACPARRHDRARLCGHTNKAALYVASPPPCHPLCSPTRGGLLPCLHSKLLHRKTQSSPARRCGAAAAVAARASSPRAEGHPSAQPPRAVVPSFPPLRHHSGRHLRSSVSPRGAGRGQRPRSCMAAPLPAVVVGSRLAAAAAAARLPTPRPTNPVRPGVPLPRRLCGGGSCLLGLPRQYSVPFLPGLATWAHIKGRRRLEEHHAAAAAPVAPLQRRPALAAAQHSALVSPHIPQPCNRRVKSPLTSPASGSKHTTGRW
jgi:hypothetical protein